MTRAALAALAIASVAVSDAALAQQPETVASLLKQDFAVEIDDRTYFVEVLLAKDNPIKIEGLKEFSCQPVVTLDKKNAYYGGYVIPEQIKLTCK